MPSIGPMEIIVILIIALVVLGPKKLPDAGRALGDGIKNFRGSLTGAADDHAAPVVATLPEPAPVVVEEPVRAA